MMDPNKCLLELIDAMLDDEFDTAMDRLDSLMYWRLEGGSAPQRHVVVEALSAD